MREMIGVSCRDNDNPEFQNNGLCQGAFYFFDVFERPTVQKGYDVIARYVAAYNIYSVLTINVWGDLYKPGTVPQANVTCKATVIKDDLQCSTRNFP